MALKEKETLAELSKRPEVHPTMIGKWKQDFLSKAASVFEKPSEADSNEQIDQIGCTIKLDGWNQKTGF